MKATIRSNLACWLMTGKRWGMGFRNVLALQIEFRLQQRQGKISW